MHAKNPCMHAKEPYIHAKEPCNQSTEPYTHAIEPYFLYFGPILFSLYYQTHSPAAHFGSNCLLCCVSLHARDLGGLRCHQCQLLCSSAYRIFELLSLCEILYVFMYIYTYIFTYIYIYIHIFIYIHPYTYIYIYMYMYVYLYIYVYNCMYMHIQVICVYTNVYRCIFELVSLCVT